MAKYKHIKLNRFEKLAANKEKLAKALFGEGVYLYRNNAGGDLKLPKPNLEGTTFVPKGGTFKGDSYFMSMVKNNELRLVEVLEKPKEIKMEEKLILDQPDIVTTEGTVEHVLTDEEKKKLEENEEEGRETLITEDPMDGIQILTD